MLRHPPHHLPWRRYPFSRRVPLQALRCHHHLQGRGSSLVVVLQVWLLADLWCLAKSGIPALPTVYSPTRLPATTSPTGLQPTLRLPASAGEQNHPSSAQVTLNSLTTGVWAIPRTVADLASAKTWQHPVYVGSPGPSCYPDPASIPIDPCNNHPVSCSFLNAGVEREIPFPSLLASPLSAPSAPPSRMCMLHLQNPGLLPKHN